MKVELTQEQIQLLLEMLNVSVIKGELAEKVVELKIALREGLEKEKKDGL